MSRKLKRLMIEKVDGVIAGACSAANVLIVKTKKEDVPMDKEQLDAVIAKLKPEHAEVIKAFQDEHTAASARITELETAISKSEQRVAELETETAELQKNLDETVDKAIDPKRDESEEGGIDNMDETEQLKKSASPEIAAYLEKLEKQVKESADFVAKAKAAEIHANAVAKAKSLATLPVAEEKLVSIIEKSSAEVIDVLEIVAKSIETTVLQKSSISADTSESRNSWQTIEKRAKEIATAESITLEKAISRVISEDKELYKQYIQEGAN